jgi:Transposase
LRQKYPNGRIAVVLEQSRGALLYALLNYSFLRLYPVNPRCLADFRDAMTASGAKGDPADADLLCEMGCKHSKYLRELELNDPATRQLVLLTEQEEVVQVLRLLIDPMHLRLRAVGQAADQTVFLVGPIRSHPQHDVLGRRILVNSSGLILRWSRHSLSLSLCVTQALDDRRPYRESSSKLSATENSFGPKRGAGSERLLLCLMHGNGDSSSQPCVTPLLEAKTWFVHKQKDARRKSYSPAAAASYALARSSPPVNNFRSSYKATERLGALCCR